MTDFPTVAQLLRPCYGPGPASGRSPAERGYPDTVTDKANDIMPDQDYPGQRLGLPAEGPGAVATWGQRLTALVLDWAISMAFAALVTWGAVLSGTGPERFGTLVVFFLEKSLFTILTGSSLGQLIVGIGVTRIDGTPIPWWAAIVRTFMICLVIPALVIGVDRRSLNDMVLRSVVVKRR